MKSCTECAEEKNEYGNCKPFNDGKCSNPAEGWPNCGKLFKQKRNCETCDCFYIDTDIICHSVNIKRCDIANDFKYWEAKK